MSETVNRKESLDSILKIIFQEVKAYNKILQNGSIDEKKDTAQYIKLIELFFKGIDIAEKINSSKKVNENNFPEIHYVKGVEINEI